jgi:hypothetical protein
MPPTKSSEHVPVKPRLVELPSDDPAWVPLQEQARSIVSLLEPRTAENRRYFKIDGDEA